MHLSIDVLTENLSGGSKVYSQMFVQMCIFSSPCLSWVIGGIRPGEFNVVVKSDIGSAACEADTYLIVPLTGLIMFYSAVFLWGMLRN